MTRIGSISSSTSLSGTGTSCCSPSVPFSQCSCWSSAPHVSAARHSQPFETGMSWRCRRQPGPKHQVLRRRELLMARPTAPRGSCSLGGHSDRRRRMGGSHTSHSRLTAGLREWSYFASTAVSEPKRCPNRTVCVRSDGRC